MDNKTALAFTRPRRQTFMAALLVIGLSLAPQRARAAEATGGEAAPSTSASVAKLTDEGFALYKGRDYRHASEKFLQAYALDQDPNLLFNIARCYEAQGDTDGAIEKYEAFLAKPEADASGRRRATEAVRQLRQNKTAVAGAPAGHNKDANAKPAPSLRATPGAEPTTLVATPAEARGPSEGQSGHRGRTIAGWVATGALAAGATVTGLMALDSARKLKTARETFPGNGADIASQSSRTTTLTISTDALAIAAALMAGVSLYWTLGDSSEARASSEVHAAVGPAGVQLGGTF